MADEAVEFVDVDDPRFREALDHALARWNGVLKALEPFDGPVEL